MLFRSLESDPSIAPEFNTFLDIVFIAFQFWVLGMSIVAVRVLPLNFIHVLSEAVSRSSMNPFRTSSRPSSRTWLPLVSEAFMNAITQTN